MVRRIREAFNQVYPVISIDKGRCGSRRIDAFSTVVDRPLLTEARPRNHSGPYGTGCMELDGARDDLKGALARRRASRSADHLRRLPRTCRERSMRRIQAAHRLRTSTGNPPEECARMPGKIIRTPSLEISHYRSMIARI
jgi:hypothetical protein